VTDPRRWLLWAAALLSAVSPTIAGAPPPVRAAPPASEIKRFVACPVYRDVDAGRKSSCWLATDGASGIRYDIGESPAKPQLGKQVLVEGVISRDPSVCGAPVLNPVRASVIDRECPRVMLPAEGLPGRRFVLPEVLAPRAVPRTPPPPPYLTRDFSIYFEWGSDFLRYQHAEIVIDKALRHLQASRASRVVIRGYADTVGLGGVDLVEPLALGRARAEMVAEAFRRLGVAESLLRVRWHGTPLPDALAELGLPGAARRRVEIRVLVR
jgi:outer membrane protein OmpA-like peptidoglycan-associated protein